MTATLLVLTACFAWINHRFLHLPPTIGLPIMGLVASFLVIGAEIALPGILRYEDFDGVIRQADSEGTVRNGMHAFLLFAGALHVSLDSLRLRAWTIGTMATLGVVISTAIVGLGVWFATSALGIPISLPWALVCGALISPTDPVAVLATLKEVKAPADLEGVLKDETLFNDGVGLVLLAALVTIAAGDAIEPMHIAWLCCLEALGGAALGWVAGYLAYRAMRAIDDYPIEVLISLALVTGTYTLASRLHLSGPIAVVIAGLLMGHRGPQDAFSDQTQQYMFGFWTLVDGILNSVHFLLIGLEVLVLRLEINFIWLVAIAVPLALLAHLVAVAGPDPRRVPQLRARNNPRAHLGRAAGRHLSRPCALPAQDS